MTPSSPPDWRTGLRHLVNLIDETGGQNREHLKKFDLYVTYLIPVLTPVEMVEFMEILGHDSHCHVTINQRGHTEVHCHKSCAHYRNYRKRLEMLKNHLNGHPERPETVACTVCGQSTRSTATELCDRCWELKTRISRDPGIAIKIINMAMDDMSPEELSRFITRYVGEEAARMFDEPNPNPITSNPFTAEPAGILSHHDVYELGEGAVVILPGLDSGSNQTTTGCDRTDPTRVLPLSLTLKEDDFLEVELLDLGDLGSKLYIHLNGVTLFRVAHIFPKHFVFTLNDRDKPHAQDRPSPVN